MPRLAPALMVGHLWRFARDYLFDTAWKLPANPYRCFESPIGERVTWVQQSDQLAGCALGTRVYLLPDAEKARDWERIAELIKIRQYEIQKL